MSKRATHNYLVFVCLCCYLGFGYLLGKGELTLFLSGVWVSISAIIGACLIINDARKERP
jgi:hypothetical protein